MRLLLASAVLLLGASDAFAAEPPGVCITEPARVVHLDRARLKAALASSLDKHEAPTKLIWIPAAHAQARLPDCDVVVRVGIRGRRRRATLDFATTFRGVAGLPLVQEVGPIDLSRIDPRSFGRVWTRLLAQWQRDAVTRLDD
ncbi:MAG: hypothetical protein RMA76_06975 [Deltaproteobacteria bacterium]